MLQPKTPKPQTILALNTKSKIKNNKLSAIPKISQQIKPYNILYFIKIWNIKIRLIHSPSP